LGHSWLYSYRNAKLLAASSYLVPVIQLRTAFVQVCLKSAELEATVMKGLPGLAVMKACGKLDACSKEGVVKVMVINFA
jgi:hypothetical protein